MHAYSKGVVTKSYQLISPVGSLSHCLRRGGALLWAGRIVLGGGRRQGVVIRMVVEHGMPSIKQVGVCILHCQLVLHEQKHWPSQDCEGGPAISPPTVIGPADGQLASMHVQAKRCKQIGCMLQ